MDPQRAPSRLDPHGMACAAVFTTASGRFEVAMSRDCLRFVGRFARLPELRHGNGLVAFCRSPLA